MRDTKTGKQILLKRNKPSKQETGRMLLRRESGILRALDHPQIPRWLGYVKRRRDEGLLMELIEGASLEQAADGGQHIYTEQEALRIARELLYPLSYLHRMGLVHRDVRIPNVIRNGDQVVLIDFGLACRTGEQLPHDLAGRLGDDPSAAAQAAGSWNEVRRYMRRPHPASDLYGLGHLMLFLLYSGYKPEGGQEERGWEEELALSPGTKAIIRRLLADEQSGGWPSATACAAELDRLRF